jgi:hypothetical protein
LSVVIASETALRNIPNTVNVEQAKSLVDKGEAIWIDPLPEVSSKQVVAISGAGLEAPAPSRRTVI